MRLPSSLICLTLSLLPGAIAVLADEAYRVDYHHELLGIPQPHTTFFHRPRKDDKATLLYTLSDLGVLGAVNPGTGKLVWRQLLTKDGNSAGTGHLRADQGGNSVVAGLRDAIGAWDALSGRSIWSNAFQGLVKDLEVMETAAGTEENNDILALYEVAGEGRLWKLKGSTGDVIWEYKDSTDDVPLQVSTNVMNVFLVSLQGARGGYNVKVTILDPVTGEKTTEYVLTAKADVHTPEDILLVGANSAAPIVAWTDRALKNLKINILGKGGEQILPLKTADGDLTKVEIHAPHLVQSRPHFLVHSHSKLSNRADVYHVDLTKGSISKAYELPKLEGNGAIALGCQDANVYFTRLTKDEVIVVSSASHGVLGRWPMNVQHEHGPIVQGVSEVVHRDGDMYAVRSAAVTTSDTWLLVRNGAEAWTRPEGLSGAVAAQWAEITSSTSLAQTLQAEAHSNPLSAYLRRVSRHIQELQYLPTYLQALPKRLLNSILPGKQGVAEQSPLVRDSFGFNKLVIVATQRGRIYALSTGNQGSILWSQRVSNSPAGKNWDVKGIWVENAKGLVTIRGTQGDYTVIKVVSGQIVETKDPGTSPAVQSTAVVESPSGKWLLPIGLDGNPGELPMEWTPSVPLVVRGDNGEVKGLRFDVGDPTGSPITAWTFQPTGQRITNVVSKPVHDPVASIGRVLGDRSVLYKYLNPNTILVTSVTEAMSSASIYLLDSVSGEVLHSATHEDVDCTQPIPSVLTENWFAYSIWTDLPSNTLSETIPSSKGYQLIISELYESSAPNDRGPLGDTLNISSLAPSEVPNSQPVFPHVITQSFIIPEQITHMSVTQTRQGITTRQLLCILASNAIFGLPRQIIDPRRPVGRDPTPLEMEEGLFRYQPIIEVDPNLVLTHKREVIGVRDVIASPAVLESTSLIFAYGIDVFGSRVAPSAAFDMLGNGFDKLSLVTTVLALWVGVMIMAPMVRRKQINARWAS